MEFTEEEVRQKLIELGYRNVPRSKLHEFMQDLKELIRLEQSETTESEVSVDENYMEGNSPDSLHPLQYRQQSLRNQQQLLQDSRQPLHDSRRPFQERIRRSFSAFSKETISNGSYNFTDKENLSSNFTSNSTSILSDTSSIVSESDYLSKFPMAYEKTHQPQSVRRKVARKQNGSTRIYDETMTDNESQCMDITDNEIRLRDATGNRRYSYASSVTEERSSMEMIHGPLRTLPAFIRSSKNQPHTRGYQKCDPVSRYHQFKTEWKHSNIPGESKRSTLRWNIREKMLNSETVYERPHHTYQKNDYVVPTDKKRQALRWQVRTALSKT